MNREIIDMVLPAGPPGSDPPAAPLGASGGAFLYLLEYTANMNEKLRDHLTNATGARNTSKDIQNNLLVWRRSILLVCLVAPPL